MSNATSFWPNNAQLAVSFSLMYEGGGQPISGAPGVIPEPIEKNLPDMPTNGVFQYGIYEGTPRLLDHGQAQREAQRFHDRPGSRQGPGPRKGSRSPGP